MRKAASFPVLLLGAAKAAAFFTLTNTSALKQLRLPQGNGDILGTTTMHTAKIEFGCETHGVIETADQSEWLVTTIPPQEN